MTITNSLGNGSSAAVAGKKGYYIPLSFFENENAFLEVFPVFLRFVYMDYFIKRHRIAKSQNILETIKIFYNDLQTSKEYPFSCFTNAQEIKAQIEKSENSEHSNYRVWLYFNSTNLVLFEKDSTTLFDHKVYGSALVIIEKKIGKKWETELIEKHFMQDNLANKEKLDWFIGIKNIGNSNSDAFLLSFYIFCLLFIFLSLF